MSCPPVRLKLFGEFQAWVGDDRPVPLRLKRARLLLGFLALAPSGRGSREELMTLLWSERSDGQARQSLRQTIAVTRRAFSEADANILRADQETVSIDLKAVESDAAAFNRLARGRALKDLEQAVALSTGDFLAHLVVRDRLAEDWLLERRAELRSLLLRCLGSLLAAYTRLERHDEAEHVASRILELDPLDEVAHRALMTVHLARGHRSLAFRQLQRCRESLQRELAATPAAETEALLRGTARERIARAQHAASSDCGRQQRTLGTSGKVHDEISGKMILACEEMGPQQLKNVGQPVRINRVDVGELVGAIPQASSSEEKIPLQVPDRPSIAVLPLTNLSCDPEQEYFGQGIAEDIITELSRISELFVIARNSSFQYKDKAVDARQIGRELGVRYLLEGSIRRDAERVRISTQLIDCATGGHLWAERFDRNLTGIFEVQDEVTRNVVAALAIKLTADVGRHLKYDGTDNLDAYDCFLRAREQRLQFSMHSIAQAEVMLKRAIALDPNYGPAYAYLGDAHLLCYMNGWGESTDQLLEQAFELATRAVALAPAYPLAHIFLGNAYLWKRQHDEALTSIREALALAPNYSGGHFWLGWILHYAGRSEEAIVPINWGMRLDPLYHPNHLHWLAQAYFQLHRYNEAVELLRRRVICAPDSDVSRVLLASAYGHLGRMSESRAEWCEALRINPNYSLEHRRRVHPYKNPADFEHFVEGLREARLTSSTSFDPSLL